MIIERVVCPLVVVRIVLLDWKEKDRKTKTW
jgi:hypothetical protein